MDNKLAKGLFAFTPHQNAPDFVKLELSIDVEQFVTWLKAQPVNERGAVKITVAESKAGKLYGKLNDYKPEEDGIEQTTNDLPF